MPNYPSPKPTFCPKWQVSVNVGVGEGLVSSFPETKNDPRWWRKNDGNCDDDDDDDDDSGDNYNQHHPLGFVIWVQLSNCPIIIIIIIIPTEEITETKIQIAIWIFVRKPLNLCWHRCWKPNLKELT